MISVQAVRQRISIRKLIATGALLGSTGLALLASFTLSSWAELAPLNHSLQHVLLFTAGVGFGGSILTVFKTKKD